MKRVIERREVKDVVLIASAVNEIDWSGLEMLRRINDELKAMDVTFHLEDDQFRGVQAPLEILAA
jgi:SulP family sulfate permease